MIYKGRCTECNQMWMIGAEEGRTYDYCGECGSKYSIEPLRVYVINDDSRQDADASG